MTSVYWEHHSTFLGPIGLCGTLIHQPTRRPNPHTLRLRKRTRGNLLTNQEVGGIGDDRNILWVF